MAEHFYNKDLLAGIYTIGEGAKGTEEEINKENDNIIKFDDELDKILVNINGAKENQNKIENEFKKSCWEKGYLNFQDIFPDFYTGYKNNKEKFKEKVLEEKETNTSSLLSKDELKRKYDLFYGKDVQKIDLLNTISVDNQNELKELEENQNILQTSIVGKNDLNISKMIEILHNHDWIKQGKEYYDNNYDKNKRAYICPFCQQETSEGFRRQLEEYFDETYREQKTQLKSYRDKYQKLTEKFKSNFTQLQSINNLYFNEKKEGLQDKINFFVGLIDQNNQSLKEKLDSPSIKIEIKKLYDNLDKIITIIKEIKQKIQEHNALIDNKKNEKEKVNNELWKFIVKELNPDIEKYKSLGGIKKVLDSLEKQKRAIEGKIEKTKKEISELEKKIKSVKPTVDAINKILENFGFKGFKLKSTDDDKHYRVVRDDDTDAKKTLSEGERNFLVFLYFYHLIDGVEKLDENIKEDKILVIDDPVSSFDSDVLFIVSNLAKGIFDKVKNNISNIKQIFIFTHNVYFYKEITFTTHSKRNGNIMYYIIRKNNSISCIDKYKACPIKTSYQLLWDDIKRDNIDCISIQNSMRRIIEFYFKFLGNLNYTYLTAKFSDSGEKIILRSLIDWMNTGSHSVIDDFNISNSNDQIDKYKDVFMKIFENTGHVSHYNMMMCIDKYKDVNGE